MLKRILAFLLCLTTLSGCGQIAEGYPVEDSSFPIEIGSVWLDEDALVRTLYGTDDVPSSVTLSITYEAVTDGKTITLGGVFEYDAKYAHFKAMRGWEPADYEYYYVRDDGVAYVRQDWEWTGPIECPETVLSELVTSPLDGFLYSYTEFEGEQWNKRSGNIDSELMYELVTVAFPDAGHVGSNLTELRYDKETGVLLGIYCVDTRGASTYSVNVVVSLVNETVVEFNKEVEL